MTFKDFNLTHTILQGLDALNFKEPTAIQAESIPKIISGSDVVGVAQTGTGKTAAFVIPLLHQLYGKIEKNEADGIRVLMLAPTRELAQQIDEHIFAIGYHTGITSSTVIGGSDFAQQSKALKSGVHIIVATPGRLLDQMRVLDFELNNIDVLVLDEADRMLDMGFIPDVNKIIQKLPKKRQNLLFSATMPNEVKKLIKHLMNEPEYIEIEASKPTNQVEQRCFHIHPNKKLDLVQHIFDTEKWESAIIFSSTKKGVDQLQSLLQKKKIDAISIHGDRSQGEREEALRKFKNSQHPVIVATDVLARGIDIDSVSMIINYDAPNNLDDYIHRVGRTGRYDQKGLAVTFMTRRDKKVYDEIKNKIGEQLIEKQLPDALGNGKKSSSNNKGGSSKNRKSSDSSQNGSERKKQSSKDNNDDTSNNNRQKNQKSGRQSKQDNRGNKPDDSGKEGSQENRRKRAPRKIKKERDSKKPSDNKGGNRNKSQSNQNQKQNSRKGRDNRRSSQNKDDDQRNRNRNRNRDNGKKRNQNRRSDKKQNEKQQNQKSEPTIVPDRIRKATERNKNVPKPAKGFWGVIKSYLPKF